MPSERTGRSPAWSIERRFDGSKEVQYLVHRGDCRLGQGDRRAADDGQARTALGQGDAAAVHRSGPLNVTVRNEMLDVLIREQGRLMPEQAHLSGQPAQPATTPAAPDFRPAVRIRPAAHTAARTAEAELLTQLDLLIDRMASLDGAIR
ncbi:DUF6233 domain-containing protein [Actinacidiphila glaucinigra]|uniref:DUF6233 domain-containing protein n=1 Tax=Actinacidiphila glaucinigra TaxID=235986 RepID=UPI00386B15E2